MTTRRGLQLEQDDRFQQAEWRFQRIAWWVLCGFVLAALLGTFGDGPLSHAVADSPQLVVRYERFARFGTPTTVRLELPTGPAGAHEPVVYVSRRYFDHVRIQRVTPEPTSIQLGADRVALRFDAAALAGDTLVIDLEPIRWGIEHVELQLGAAAPVHFRQIIFF